MDTTVTHVPRLPGPDLGPLAWVLGEVHKTLDGACKPLRRHLREAQAAPAGPPDPQHLAPAGQALHQCAGALQMVGQHACAALVLAMQAAVQRFASQQQACDEPAVASIEQACFALVDYLEAVLAGKPASAVELFPQYREVQALAGQERIHPADLWETAWHWAEPVLAAHPAPLAYDAALRSRFDQAVLRVVKTGDAAAARELQDLGLGLAAGAATPAQRDFWALAAGYFQAQAQGLVPPDLYGKRMASRLLTQYAALARGDAEPSPRLAQDLLFYCARALAQADGDTEADTLRAVCSAHGLAPDRVDDYERRRFGRFNPAVLAQVRKRIAAAADSWSALAGGDTQRLKPVQEQFGQMGEAVARLHADSQALTQALAHAADTLVQAGHAPPPELAMEVATAMLYLEAAYTDPDQAGTHMRARAELLAGRLDHVLLGGAPGPLLGWMEDLVHRVGERRTLLDLAAELHRTQAEVEQLLDQFFRAPREKGVLGKVGPLLAQMRGVLAMLDLDQAAHAVQHMQATVNGYLVDAPDETRFERLARGMGMLGQLIDMLAHQRALAQQAFVYDEQAQSLRLTADAPYRDVAPDPVPQAAPAPAPAIAASDEETRTIGPLRVGLALFNAFLNEAEESSQQLQAELGDWSQHQPAPAAESSLALAHALAGGAATVGFEELSHLARTLALVLERQRQADPALPFETRPVVDAAEEIRQLLHQFAAGLLRAPRAQVLQALEALLQPTAPEPADDAGVVDHDLDAVDAIDPDLFGVFEDEAAVLLPRLSTALRQWHATPSDFAARRQTLRALHTFKGSARFTGALRLGELAHRLETAAEQLDGEALTAARIGPLLAGADRLQAVLDALRAGLRAPAAAAAPLAQPLPPQPTSGPSVRVRTELLDRLVGHGGEVLAAHARLQGRVDQFGSLAAELSGNLDRLRRQLHELESQAGARPADHAARVQELTRMLAESVADLAAAQRTLQRTLEGAEDDLVAQGRHARELQRDLLRTRMVAFDALAERLQGVVRQSAKDLERQARLDIDGGAIELDRGVLERMAPAFEHLLRNAVAHGIEDAATRAAAGKPACGTVRLAVAQQGNDIAIEIADDGRGLDLPRIQARAQALGLLPEDGQLTLAEAAELIFLTGFTTAGQVSELAGRGIGMDAVRSEVQALGGRIDASSPPGAGMRLRIVLPLTTAVAQVLVLRAGPLTFGIPTALVQAVCRVPAGDLGRHDDSQSFAHAGETLPFYNAGALLRAGPPRISAGERPASVLVLRSARQGVALHVDEVLGQQEVVVRHLGPQLSRLPGLAGLSVLASGAVLPLYDPVALAAVHGACALQAQRDGVDAALAPVPLAPLVLVVDDSMTVRRVAQRLLQREGYRVALAADGQQALALLQQERPVLVLSDIEMPRMDGFALTRSIRADARLATLPIVIVTSRAADRHREQALGLGASHILGKPYDEAELLALVQRYARHPA